MLTFVDGPLIRSLVDSSMSSVERVMSWNAKVACGGSMLQARTSKEHNRSTHPTGKSDSHSKWPGTQSACLTGMLGEAIQVA